MLIFDPAGAWERIEADPRNAARVFFMFLVPLMLLSGAAEYAGLVHFGMERSGIGDLPGRHVNVSQQLALRYEAVQLVFGFILIFGCAALFKKIGEGFHRRHSFTETFITVAYSASPLFLCRIFAGLPHLNTWICWAVGVTLSVAVLYRGIPRIMKPDPSNALGLYIMCSLLLIALSGLAQLVANLVLQQNIFAG